MAKSIVLRDRARKSTAHPFAGVQFLSAGQLNKGAEPGIETADVEKQHLTSLANDSEVVAVAPVMPLRLIQPFGPATEADAAKVGVAWGIQAVGADQTPYTGKGITVAVLDTGIDAKHPAFAGLQIVQQDFTGEGNDDAVGHGTHCAGTICGRNLGSTRIGIAQGIDKLLVGKVLGKQGGDTEALSRAMLWAVESGANVISMSLGYDFAGMSSALVEKGYPADLATSRALEAYRATLRLFDSLAHLIEVKTLDQGCILCAAAGNESRRDLNPAYELGVAPPAAGEGFVSVGAVGLDAAGKLTVAKFSNTGPELCAPGVDIVSAKVGGGLCKMSGTSMATPHVAGVSALWAQRLRETTGYIKSSSLKACVIGRTSRAQIAQEEEAADTGSGLVQAPTAL